MNTTVEKVAQEFQEKIGAAVKEFVVLSVTAVLNPVLTTIPVQPQKTESEPISYKDMEIVPAAIAYLKMTGNRKGTNEIHTALTEGGLKCHYNTIYTLLRRRQEKVGDIKSVKGKWGLVEKFQVAA